MTATKTVKKPAKKTAAKSSSKKPAAAKNKVDIYPNRVSLAVATLAAVALVVFGFIALS